MFSPGDVLTDHIGESFVITNVCDDNRTMEIMVIVAIHPSEPDYYPVGYKFDVLQRVWSNHVRRGIVTHSRNGKPVPIPDPTMVMCG